MSFSGAKMQNRHIFAHFIMKNLAIDFSGRKLLTLRPAEGGLFWQSSNTVLFTFVKKVTRS